MKFSIKSKWSHIILITILTALVYINIFPNEFVWDDEDFIVEWHETRELKSIPDFFRGSLPTGHEGVYRPLRSVFYALSYKLWGLNPVGYHFQSILVHVLCSILVYLIVLRFTNKNVALMTALLFGVHPIHIESITFITTSFDIIGVLFFLMSFYLYIKASEENNQESKNRPELNSSFIVEYSGSLLFALLAFFTYELTITLPAFIILYDMLVSKRTDSTKISVKKLASKLFSQSKIYILFFLLAGFYLFNRIFLLHILGRSSYLANSFYHTMLVMAKAFAKYIQLLILPFNLNNNHMISEGIYALYYGDKNDAAVLAQFIFEPYTILSIVLLLLIIGAAVWFFRKKPIISFSILWFFIGLAPVAYLIPQAAIMSEKYVYIASIGYCLLLSHIFYLVHVSTRKLENHRDIKKLLIVAFIMVLVFYSAVAVNRNLDWRSETTLWQSTVRQSPGSALAHLSLGTSLEDKEKAIEEYNRALEIDPDNYEAFVNLGTAYGALGKTDKAIEQYEKAMELRPERDEVYINLGVAYSTRGEFEKAIELYKKAISIDPEYSLSYYNLGNGYYKSDQYDMAIDSYEKAISKNPNNKHFYTNLGLVYETTLQYELAIEQYQKALSLDPQYDVPFYNLGNVYYQIGRKDLAVQSFKKAVELNPKYTHARYNLALVYEELGRIDDAIAQYNKIVEFNPKDRGARIRMQELNELFAERSK